VIIFSPEVCPVILTSSQAAIAKSNTVALDFGWALFGRAGGVVFAIVVALSCLGALTGAPASRRSLERSSNDSAFSLIGPPRARFTARQGPSSHPFASSTRPPAPVNSHVPLVYSMRIVAHPYAPSSCKLPLRLFSSSLVAAFVPSSG